MSASAAPADRPPLALARATLLGHAGHTTLLTATGAGGSWAGGHALARWRSDPIEERYGWFVHLADRERGARWTLGLAPGRTSPERYAVAWRPGGLTITRVEAGIEAVLEAWVDADGPVELRRVTVRDLSGAPRRIEVAAAFEIALQRPDADAHHPAFSRLFVQTECAGAAGPWLARRRPRGHDERHPVLALAAHAPAAIEWDTDRARILGRGRTWADPAAFASDAPLAAAAGNVLDPAFATRARLALEPGGRATVTLALASADAREGAIAQLARVADAAAVERSRAGAERAAAATLAALGLDARRGERALAIAAGMLAGERALRTGADVVERARGERASLRALGLDPARPFAIVTVAVAADRVRLADALAVHRLARAHGADVALLVIGEAGAAAGSHDGVVVASASLEAAALDLARAAAAWDADATGPGVIERLTLTDPAPPEVAPAAAPRPAAAREPGGDEPEAPEPLRHWNGIGGFSADGREYVVRLGRGGAGRPPMPWVNVVANERAGVLVSESGAASTWWANSRELRLTPWSNDPLVDPHGEALWLHDLDADAVWSPTPGPAPGPAPYEVRHGLGATAFHHASHGIESALWLFVPRHDPVRIARLRLVNRSPRPRRLAVVAYARLVLGALPEESARFVVTAHDRGRDALLARNRVAGVHAHAIAFAAALAPPRAPTSVTADREAFLGRGGDPARPRAVARGGPLDGRAGAGLDPCFATRIELALDPGEVVECAFALGAGAGEDEVDAVLARLRAPGAIERAQAEVAAFWSNLVAGVHIETPESALDLVVNAWLPYQALGCRMWGRTAFFQSSGAYGFRDQLQDAMAMIPLDPALAREQIVRHAAHQFVEGDVLHWWHPPGARGMRTRFADDRLWLPHLAATYVRATGDHAVLDATAPFLAARALEPGEDEALVEPRASGEAASVYEHACRAIERSLATGPHGLPLFGTGDWNDGMNRVGREGRGESVWMAFFLHAVLDDFIPIAEQRDDGARARRWRAHRGALREAIERAAWDGDWYRRGYYDDGTPLGTHADSECRIDGLVQAWSVLSGAAPPARARAAMASAERLLVFEREGLIKLLTPAFDRTPHDPGYIKGYVRGVRENGGQYTHAALWFVRALAALGRRDRAAPLLAMLSPVSRAASPEAVARYQVEPYVVAADVYGEPPHVGRGGWTWYTGSAAWMHRVAIESVLGLTWVEGAHLRIAPCVPDAWPGFRARLRVPGDATVYDVRVRVPHGDARAVVHATVDGTAARIESGAAWIAIVRDGATHRVHVDLGPPHEAEPSLAPPGAAAERGR